MNITQYDLWLADLNPRKGHVQSGVRPCVIVQSNLFNAYSSTVVVVPLTTTMINVFPSEFVIQPSSQNGLSAESRFLGSQIITLDKRYLTKKLGSLNQDDAQQAYKALHIVLAKHT